VVAVRLGQRVAARDLRASPLGTDTPCLPSKLPAVVLGSRRRFVACDVVVLRV
jgi:hypothetical protein